jgi:hypothetical protein
MRMKFSFQGTAASAPIFELERKSRICCEKKSEGVWKILGFGGLVRSGPGSWCITRSSEA